MEPPRGYGQIQGTTTGEYKPQRIYRNPRNDPSNWGRGGGATPQYPGAGQTGQGYGSPLGSSFGSVNTAPPAPNLGYGQGVTGWQTQLKPDQPQMSPPVDMEWLRRILGQSGFGQGQFGQGVTQPFQTQAPWQQRVPQTFNQGAAYSPFVRRW